MVCRLALLWGVATAFGLIGPAAVAQKDVKTCQAEIQASYSKIAVAYRHHDLKAYGELMTPEVKIIGPDGKSRDFKASLALTRADMAATGKIRSAKLVFHGSTVHGNEVTSDVTEVWDCDTIDTKGEYGPKGKVYPTIWCQRGIHTHVRTGHDWLLQRLVSKGNPTFTFGGKPLIPLSKNGKKP